MPAADESSAEVIKAFPEGTDVKQSARPLFQKNGS
jgi:hypothetical protein